MTAAVVPGTSGIYPAMRERLAAIFANCAILHRTGACLVCSSDAGVGPNKPHDALPYGVVNVLPVLGMSNAEALTNVTAFAAEVCGLAHVTGTLEVGKDADLLAVAGNPVEDLAAIHDVVAVFAGAAATVRTGGVQRSGVGRDGLLLKRRGGAGPGARVARHRTTRRRRCGYRADRTRASDGGDPVPSILLRSEEGPVGFVEERREVETLVVGETDGGGHGGLSRGESNRLRSLTADPVDE